MSAEIPADIAPGYKFSVTFMTPAAEVNSAPAVQDTLQHQLGIPDEHNLHVLELAPVGNQDPRLTNYLGSVSFMHFGKEWSAVSTLKADIHVGVYAPSLVTRALARVFRFKSKAKVLASAEGARPFGENGGVKPEPSPVIGPTDPSTMPSGPLIYA